MTSTLHTLLAHAERQRDAALAAVQRAEQQAQLQRQQAEQLAQYRQEYQQRSPTHNGRSTGIDTLRGHLAFMARLQQAVAQQLVQVGHADAALAHQRGLLLTLEVRLASVQKLLQRRQLEAQRLNERRDQNRSDEAASQRLWRAALAAAEACESLPHGPRYRPSSY
jgi:flagellar protein FliJ